MRGDAFQIVQRIPHDQYANPDGSGVKTLREEHVFPEMKIELKALTKVFRHSGGGLLSWQRSMGVPVKNYIARRTIAYDMWHQMDPRAAETLDNNDRGDLLLDNANLNKMEKRLLLATTQDSLLFSHVEHTSNVHFATEHHQ